MFQFYLLSILFNTLAGIVLISIARNNTELAASEKKVDVWGEEVEDSDDVTEKKSKKETIKNMGNKISSSEVFTNQTFRLVVGILAFVVGFLKLFIIVKSDIKVLGDFFPAVFGLFSGFAVVLNFYLHKTSMEDVPEAINFLFVKNNTILGFATICVALLHFIFPEALFL